MKKLAALLLTIVLLVSQTAFASSYTIVNSNQQYKDIIAEAIEKSAFTIEELDEDNIFIVENTSYINLKNNIKPTLIWVALPIFNTDDISFAAFENGIYKNEITNFPTFEGMIPPYNEELERYISNNQLAAPEEVTNLWVSERVHLFAYKVICDNIEYIIPHKFADFSVYNLTEDKNCVLEIGKAYKTEDFIAICEKEAGLYAEHKIKERSKENRPTISLDENGDEVVKINGVNLDDALELVNESIHLMNKGATIKFGIKTETDDYMTTYRKQENGDISKISKFAVELFDEFKTQIAAGTPSSRANASYCKIRNNIIINVWNDGVSIRVSKDKEVVFKIKNSEPIVSILKKYSTNAFDGFTCEMNDENTPHIKNNINDQTKTDIIEFEYQIPFDANNSLTQEVAVPGEIIKCIFEKYKKNKYNSTYVLTFKGSKGTISLYTEAQSSLDGVQELYSNNIPIAFRNKYRYENGNLVEYTTGKQSDKYELKLVFSAGDIKEVNINDIQCTNLSYTQLTEDSKLIKEYIEKDKEVVLKQSKECADTLYDLGLFKGTDNGYELEKGLTREESATILVRLLGKENEIDANDFEEAFDDVDKSRWSYAYVMYCYENNITKGTSHNTFSPDAHINAQQFITLLMRLLGYTEVNPDTALQKSVDHRLLPADMIEKLENEDVFTRSVMVQIVYNSLNTKMNNDTIFYDYLLKQGVLNETDITQIR